jgi:oxygen-independent coproporphyrinogen III oxidase
MAQAAGIYIHIPFCETRCHYCNFVTGGFETHIASRYVEALCMEIGESRGQGAIDTIYFGGGTPTTLEPKQLARLIEVCADGFELSNNAEITAEANPGSVTRETLSELRAIGINRLSFGVQSFDDSELQMLGRTHSAQEAREAIAAAYDAGFSNVSLDLIAGLPEQLPETWSRNVTEALALRPEHISVYLLELYRDAPLQHRIEHGELKAIDDELTVSMYFELLERAASSGYEQYEISNWARPGYESRHNLKYWESAPYWAFGVSAAGYDGRTRWSNTRNLQDYLERVEHGQSPVAERVSLSEEDLQSESLFLKLRLREGVDLDSHNREFGIDVRSRYGEELVRLEEAGLIEFDDQTMRITRAGKVLANEVFAAFV